MWQMEEAGWLRHVKGFLIGRPLNGAAMMNLDAYDAVLEVAFLRKCEEYGSGSDDRVPTDYPDPSGIPAPNRRSPLRLLYTTRRGRTEMVSGLF